jgi:recombinational DNA repair protein (RecF pathway)
MNERKIKCVHCGQNISIVATSTTIGRCSCGKVAHVNGVIIEGSQGIDWLDVSPVLLNG